MWISKIIGKCRRTAGKYQAYWMGRRQVELMVDLSFSEAARRFADRNRKHAYMHHYFSQLCPRPVKEHRNYFTQESRGFGEDAFHAMWYLLFKEFRPVRCLEIGVYRGQVISLWALLARLFEFPCLIHGISPFTPAGDHVSTYLADIDYKADTIKNHEAFGLPPPSLLKAYSTDEEARTLIRSEVWDLIYIDGNHDYEVVLADYEVCKDSLAEGGLLVVDDSSLYTNYRPPFFSFAGHPGPSRIARDRAMYEMQFLGAVGHNNIFIRAKA
jgi:hypothetical protein